MKRLLAEPLLHFLVLGAALFCLFSLVDTKDAGQPAVIVVSAARIENLANNFGRAWKRPPSADELRGLIDDYIHDEVFYREGKALGLDRDDIIIRRRMRQKLEFMAEDVSVTEPSDEQLAAYLAANSERFRTEDRVTFNHIYLSSARRETLEHDANLMAAKLAAESPGTDIASLGDHFLLGEEFHEVPRSDLVGTFGQHFAEEVFNMEPGRWHGPVWSSYGLHFVRVNERTQGGPLPLDAVREAVRRDWMNARRLEAERNLYKTLRARYQVVIAPPSGGKSNSSADHLVGAAR
jgi:hypothetical protein